MAAGREDSGFAVISKFQMFTGKDSTVAGTMVNGMLTIALAMFFRTVDVNTKPPFAVASALVCL